MKIFRENYKIMYIVLILGLFLVSVVICINNVYEAQNEENKFEGFTYTIKDGIKYSSGVYYSKEWGNKYGAYTGDAIPDEETAIEVATALYRGLPGNYKNSRREVCSVFYDEEEELWIVGFGVKYEKGATISLSDGSGFLIAFRKSDGQVICMRLE